RPAELLAEDGVGGTCLGEFRAECLLAGDVGVGDRGHVRLGGDVEIGGLEAVERERVSEVREFEGEGEVIGVTGHADILTSAEATCSTAREFPATHHVTPPASTFTPSPPAPVTSA